jgi:hypothetical protein
MSSTASDDDAPGRLKRARSVFDADTKTVTVPQYGNLRFSLKDAKKMGVDLPEDANDVPARTQPRKKGEHVQTPPCIAPLSLKKDELEQQLRALGVKEDDACRKGRGDLKAGDITYVAFTDKGGYTLSKVVEAGEKVLKCYALGNKKLKTAKKDKIVDWIAIDSADVLPEELPAEEEESPPEAKIPHELSAAGAERAQRALQAVHDALDPGLTADEIGEVLSEVSSVLLDVARGRKKPWWMKIPYGIPNREKLRDAAAAVCKLSHTAFDLLSPTIVLDDDVRIANANAVATIVYKLAKKTEDQVYADLPRKRFPQFGPEEWKKWETTEVQLADDSTVAMDKMLERSFPRRDLSAEDRKLRSMGMVLCCGEDIRVADMLLRVWHEHKAKIALAHVLELYRLLAHELRRSKDSTITTKMDDRVLEEKNIDVAVRVLAEEIKNQMAAK